MRENAIHLVDCLAGMQRMKPQSVDMVLCDLPYGTTQCKWDEIIPFAQLWAAYDRVTKPNAAIVLFSAQPFTAKLIASNLQNFRYEWIYEKGHASGHLNAKRMPMRAHENICVFYKAQPTYNPQITTGHRKKVARAVYKRGGDGQAVYGAENRDTLYSSTQRYPRDVLYFPNTKTGLIHPTQKPVAVCEYFIETYTNPGELVLDNCAGSGTTGIACMNLDRRFILMENDPAIYHKANQRLNDHVPQLRIC